MHVKDLIKETLWHPSSDYSNQHPKISVLLPTFCRAKSGLFEKTINSILQQSFRDFEIIIIDDASTDGTAELIQQFMQKDTRINCLRHPENIGLPAVSEYEAFMKARGEYFIFAFDDFVFESDAFENLYNALQNSPHSVCHGLVKIHFFDPKSKTENFLLLGNNSAEEISQTNTIANSSIIIKKEVLDTVGLYDPHLLVTRVCDWDLWMRISKKYFIKKIDALIGSEYGVATNDSLGHTYYNNVTLVREYVTSDRDNALLPSNFSEYNIIEKKSSYDAYMQFYIDEALKFYVNKPWYTQLNLPRNSSNIPKKILFYGAQSTLNYYLYFAGLNFEKSPYLIENPAATGTTADLYTMLRADLIIFNNSSQTIFPYFHLIKNVGIPCYCLMNDNLAHAPKELLYLLENVNGILTCCSSLQKDFIENKLHSTVYIYNPVLDVTLLNSIELTKKSGNKINIAIIEPLGEKIALAPIVSVLNHLNKTMAVTLYTFANAFNENTTLEFNHVEIKARANYHQFIYELRTLDVDLIIYTGEQEANSEYTKNSILLTALYLNANIIVTDTALFPELDEKRGVIKTNNTQNELEYAFTTVMNDAQSLQLKSNLHAYCTEFFNKDKGIAVLDTITAQIQPCDYLTYEQRVNKLTLFLASSGYSVRHYVKHILHKIWSEILKLVRLS